MQQELAGKWRGTGGVEGEQGEAHILVAEFQATSDSPLSINSALDNGGCPGLLSTATVQHLCHVSSGSPELSLLESWRRLQTLSLVLPVPTSCYCAPVLLCPAVMFF